jgi:hypothetical protein
MRLNGATPVRKRVRDAFSAQAEEAPPGFVRRENLHLVGAELGLTKWCSTRNITMVIDMAGATDCGDGLHSQAFIEFLMPWKEMILVRDRMCTTNNSSRESSVESSRAPYTQSPSTQAQNEEQIIMAEEEEERKLQAAGQRNRDEEDLQTSLSTFAEEEAMLVEEAEERHLREEERGKSKRTYVSCDGSVNASGSSGSSGNIQGSMNAGSMNANRQLEHMENSRERMAEQEAILAEEEEEAKLAEEEEETKLRRQEEEGQEEGQEENDKEKEQQQEEEQRLWREEQQLYSMQATQPQAALVASNAGSEARIFGVQERQSTDKTPRRAGQPADSKSIPRVVQRPSAQLQPQPERRRPRQRRSREEMQRREGTGEAVAMPPQKTEVGALRIQAVFRGHLVRKETTGEVKGGRSVQFKFRSKQKVTSAGWSGGQY